MCVRAYVCACVCTRVCTQTITKEEVYTKTKLQTSKAQEHERKLTIIHVNGQIFNLHAI